MNHTALTSRYRLGFALSLPLWARMVLITAMLGCAAVASAQVKESVIYSFQGGSDGATPVGSIVIDKAGNIYGATVYATPCSKSLQCGSVYQLSPPQRTGGMWTETTLYNFRGHDNGDGGSPEGGLIQDAAGNLYGTTGYGGTGPCILLGTPTGCGTVYELVRPKQPGGKWIERVLYSFQGNQDGQFPMGDLVFDKRGNLYGATWFGGGKGTSCNPLYPYCGTVFKLTPPRSTDRTGAWKEEVLHSFDGVETGDGGNPNGGLLVDTKSSAIYGTTVIGGYNCPHNSGQGCGTVFRLSPSDHGDVPWTEEVLHEFGSDGDGAGPNGNLAFDASDNLYGTTEGGGKSPSPTGTVFRFAHQPDGRFEERIVHSFADGYDGGLPQAGVIFGADGNLYGNTASGGANGGGTLFRVLVENGVFQPLYQFQAPPDGSFPHSPVTFGPRGNLFGTTTYGGSGQACGNTHCGTVFMAGSQTQVVSTTSREKEEGRR